MNLRAQDSTGKIYCFDVFDITGSLFSDDSYFHIKGVEMRLICRTLERGIGRTDKNSVGLYEGDIVAAPEGADGNRFQGEKKNHVIDMHSFCDLSSLEDDNVQIIGNIHNNAELLEAK